MEEFAVNTTEMETSAPEVVPAPVANEQTMNTYEPNEYPVPTTPSKEVLCTVFAAGTALGVLGSKLTDKVKAKLAEKKQNGEKGKLKIRLPFRSPFYREEVKAAPAAENPVPVVQPAENTATEPKAE